MDQEKGLILDVSPLKLLLKSLEGDFVGSLYLKNQDALKIIYFNKGKIYWAFSNSQVDKLENILQEKNFIDKDTIDQFKGEQKQFQSVAKTLVDQEIISLIEFTDAAKEQLKRIVSSIIDWQAGEFQWVEEPPLDNHMTLNLDVIDFVLGYIIKNLKADYIWQELKSPDLTLINNADEEINNRFKPTERQKAIINLFDGTRTIAKVLDRFAEKDRSLALKLIYYFCITHQLGMLNHQPQDMLNVPMDEISQDSEEYTLGDAPESEPDDLIQVESDEPTPAKKSRVTLYTSLSIFSVMILVVLYYFFMKPVPESSITVNSSPNQLNQIQEVEEKSIAPDSKPEVKKPSLSKEQTTPPPEKKITPKKIEKPIPPKALPSPWKPFARGDLLQASKLWQKDLRDSGKNFGILLEMDCLKESVLRAYKKVASKKDFYILRKVRNGKTCYLVMMGKYSQKPEAEKALKSAPQYFWNQENPPIVIDIRPYF